MVGFLCGAGRGAAIVFLREIALRGRGPRGTGFGAGFAATLRAIFFGLAALAARLRAVFFVLAFLRVAMGFRS